MKSYTTNNKELVAIFNGLEEFKKSKLTLSASIMHKIVKNRLTIERALAPYIEVQIDCSTKHDRNTDEGRLAYLKEMEPLGNESVTVELETFPLDVLDHTFFDMDGMLALMCMIE